jgi:CBS domain-containing protein
VEIENLTDKSVAELRTKLVEVPPWAPLTKVVSVLRRRHAYEAFVVSDATIGMISVRDILGAKHVHSRKASSLAAYTPRVTPESSITLAATLMTEYRVRALPLEDESRLVGEVTALSVCKALRSSKGLNFAISKIMTRNPITLGLSDPLAKAKTLMNRRKVDHLPVLHDEKIVGVVTSRRLLDSVIPPERPMKYGWRPEARSLNSLSIGGMMERPFTCDASEKASSVLGRLVERNKSYALVGIGEELQGIVTYRDFMKLLARRVNRTVPVYMVGLPDNPFEAQAARMKFTRAVNLLRRSHPEIVESRCTIKTSSPRGKKGRRRYEVKTLIYTPHRLFVHSESGWDLPSIFDMISDRLKKVMTRARRLRRER